MSQLYGSCRERGVIRQACSVCGSYMADYGVPELFTASDLIFLRAVQQAEDGGHHPLGLDTGQTSVMSLWTNALVTVAARHVLEQHPTFHLPRRVLRIGQRVHINHRRPERGRDVRGAGIVGDLSLIHI